MLDKEFHGFNTTEVAIIGVVNNAGNVFGLLARQAGHNGDGRSHQVDGRNTTMIEFTAHISAQARVDNGVKHGGLLVRIFEIVQVIAHLLQTRNLGQALDANGLGWELAGGRVDHFACGVA